MNAENPIYRGPIKVAKWRSIGYEIRYRFVLKLFQEF